MIVQRVGPLSFAKIAGILYALVGLLLGAMISVVSILSSTFMPNEGSGSAGMLFGAAAVVALPIFYGVLGFVMSLIAAALYNLVAHWVGGIELDLQ